GCLILEDGEECPTDSGFKDLDGEPKVYKRGNGTQESPVEEKRLTHNYESLVRSNDTVFDCSPIAHFSIDRDGNLATANSKARVAFGISNHDLGKPFQDLEISYRPIELRSLIEQSLKKNKLIVSSRVPRHLAGRTQFFDVFVQPMIDERSERVGVCVQFD